MRDLFINDEKITLTDEQIKMLNDQAINSVPNGGDIADGKELTMKNEFMFTRPLLTNKKKRYCSSIVLREGEHYD